MSDSPSSSPRSYPSNGLHYRLTLLAGKVDLKRAGFVLAHVLLAVGAAKDIELDILEPDAVSRPSAEPSSGLRLVRDKCRPHRALPELALPDCSMKAYAPGVRVLVDDQRMLESVVDNLPKIPPYVSAEPSIRG